jgi:hypothetical protein
MDLDGEQRGLAFESGPVHLLPNKMAKPDLLSCHDVKKFYPAYIFRCPDHPNL